MATQPIYIYGDTANAVLNTARSRIDDLILTPAGSPTGVDPGQQQTQVGGGTLLAELNDDGSLCLRTQIIFNSAYRKFQKYLSNLGHRLFSDTQTIPTLPANVAADPTIQSWISWNGNFNGTAFASTPALPENFLAPLNVSERPAGANVQFTPMVTCLGDLRRVPGRTALNRQWLWQKNALYFMGATAATDLQVTFKTFFPDLMAVGNTPWYYAELPIPNCLSPLAWYIAYEVCHPRGDDGGAAIALQNGQDEAGKLFNDQAIADQRMKQVTESIPRPTPSPQQS